MAIGIGALDTTSGRVPKVELTSTKRTGLHRYTFPESEDAWLMVDLSQMTNR